MRGLDGITDLVDMGLSKFQEVVQNRDGWRAAFLGSQMVGHDSATQQQQKYCVESIVEIHCESESHSVMSDSSQTHGLYSP